VSGGNDGIYLLHHENMCGQFVRNAFECLMHAHVDFAQLLLACTSVSDERVGIGCVCEQMMQLLVALRFINENEIGRMFVTGRRTEPYHTARRKSTACCLG